jgi:pimeloyl-ACP methyl ester carboxylesterase
MRVGRSEHAARVQFEGQVVSTEGYASTNGVWLWYEDSGRRDGPPLVFVMGVDASALWWPRELVDVLTATGYRVVLFDNRDVGLSTYVDESSPPYGLDDMVADTVGLLDALELSSAHIVGSSLGGMIGQQLALVYPDRVRSLTLISTTPGFDERLSPPTDALLAFFAAPPNGNPSQHTVDFARALSGSRFPFDEAYVREIAAADLARGTNPNSRHALIPASAPSRVDALGAVRAPTLVVHGTEDPLFPFDHAEVLARAIPGATLVPWISVGHELPPQLVPRLTRLIIDHVGRAEAEQ